MNEPTQNPKLNEEQMDQLLSTFYRMELPAELDSLPSSWPAVIRQSADEVRKSVAVTLKPASPEPARHAAPAAGRGIAVAAATLAACLLIMAVSNIGSQTPTSSGVATTVEPDDRDADGAMINVSGGGDALEHVEVGENGLTVDELDAISIDPPAMDKEKKTVEQDK